MLIFKDPLHVFPRSTWTGLSHHVHELVMASPMEKPYANSVVPVPARLPCSHHRGAKERAGRAKDSPRELGVQPLGFHVMGGHSQPCPAFLQDGQLQG